MSYFLTFVALRLAPLFLCQALAMMIVNAGFHGLPVYQKMHKKMT